MRTQLLNFQTFHSCIDQNMIIELTMSYRLSLFQLVHLSILCRSNLRKLQVLSFLLTLFFLFLLTIKEFWANHEVRLGD
jgi:hypothetical protein